VSVTVGEKRGINSLLDDSVVSDSSDPFCFDSDSLNDHTEQESEETVVFTTEANRGHLDSVEWNGMVAKQNLKIIINLCQLGIWLLLKARWISLTFI